MPPSGRPAIPDSLCSLHHHASPGPQQAPASAASPPPLRVYLATSQVEGSVLVLIQHSKVCLPSIQQKFYKAKGTERD